MNAILTRFDKSHCGTCHVYRQTEADNTLALDQRFFGFQISTSDADLASVFGTECLDPQMLAHVYQDATQAGDFLFGMSHGLEGDRHWFQFQNHLSLANGELNPSGFVRWSKKAWQRTNTASYDRIEVARTLRDIVEDRVQAVLNGELFKAIVDSDTGEHVCFEGFLTPEDAIAEAQLQFPEIKFREEEFVVQYRIA